MTQTPFRGANCPARQIVAAGIVRACVVRNTMLTILALLALPGSAQACSVCFGDPESPMMKGAAAGVYVMVGVVSFVLMAIAGTACFWLVRCRRFAAGHSAERMDS